MDRELAPSITTRHYRALNMVGFLQKKRGYLISSLLLSRLLKFERARAAWGRDDLESGKLAYLARVLPHSRPVRPRVGVSDGSIECVGV